MSSIMHLLPILVAAAFALAIVAERTIVLYVRYPIRNLDQFFEKITDLVMAGKVAEAISVCDKLGNKPSAHVVKLALHRAHQPESLIESGLELEVGKAADSIERRTQFLAMIANVATLMGLFGTIAGLISSFQAIGQADAAQKSALLATGISQAMNATMLGLGVAIPCMVAFSFLMNRTNRLVSEVDHSAVRAMDVLRQRFYSAQVGALRSVRKKAQESF